jgi:hypothetical protein
VRLGSLAPIPTGEGGPGGVTGDGERGGGDADAGAGAGTTGTTAGSGASGNAESFACWSFEVMPPVAMLSYLPAGVLVITAASQGMPLVAMLSLLPAGVLK